MVASTCHQPINRLTLFISIDAVFFLLASQSIAIEKQLINEVTPWPRIPFRITAMTKTKDTLIPARKTLSAKTKMSIWDVTRGLT
jgi:hypothetical protein